LAKSNSNPMASTTTVYVGNLSWDTTDESLSDAFDAKCTVATAVVQRHADSQRSKGWGLVSFAKESDVADAIAEFNDTVLDGRTIIVRADRGATRPSTDGGERQPRRQRQQRNMTDTKTVEDDGPAAPSTKLFVGNLTWDTTSEQLEAYFSKVGVVASAEVIYKQDTHPPRSRGWGIVEMEDIDAATAALDLDDTEIDGRAIKVQFQKSKARATRKPRRAARDTKRVLREDVDAAPSKSIYIGNLPWSYGDEDLSELFGDFGVVDAEVKQGFDGRSRGYGIVTFDSMDDAGKAIEAVNNTDCGGRNVVVRFDRGGVKA